MRNISQEVHLMKLDYLDRGYVDENKLFLCLIFIENNEFCGQLNRHISRDNEFDMDSFIELVLERYGSDGISIECKEMARLKLTEWIQARIDKRKQAIESSWNKSPYFDKMIKDIIKGGLKIINQTDNSSNYGDLKELLQKYVEISIREKEPERYVANEKLIKHRISVAISHIH